MAAPSHLPLAGSTSSWRKGQCQRVSGLPLKSTAVTSSSRDRMLGLKGNEGGAEREKEREKSDGEARAFRS